MSEPHNHVTRDIKPPGVCPGCDAYHRSQEEGNRAEPSAGGESRNGGESRAGGEFLERAAVNIALRAALTQELRDVGHDDCADDLRGADEDVIEQVANDIAEHVEYACGCPHGQHPELAGRLHAWAEQHETLFTGNDGVTLIAGHGLPVETRREGTELFVDLKSGDILDLSRETDMVVTISVTSDDGDTLRLFSFHRMGPEVTSNGEPPA